MSALTLGIPPEIAYVLAALFGALYLFDQFVIAYSGAMIVLSSPHKIYDLVRGRTHRVRDYKGFRIVYGLKKTGTSYRLVLESRNRAQGPRRMTIEVHGSPSVSLTRTGLDTLTHESGCKIVDDIGFLEHNESIIRVYNIALAESPKSDEHRITPVIIVHENHVEDRRELSSLTIKT